MTRTSETRMSPRIGLLMGSLLLFCAGAWAGASATLRMSTDTLRDFEAATLAVEIRGDGRADVYLALLEPGDGIRFVKPDRTLGRRGVAVALVENWGVHPVVKEDAVRITGLDLPAEGEYTWLLTFVPPGAEALASGTWIASASTSFTYTMGGLPAHDGAEAVARRRATVVAEAPLAEWMVQAASWSGLDWGLSAVASCGSGVGFSGFTPLLWSWHRPWRRRVCTRTVPTYFRRYAGPWLSGWDFSGRVCRTRVRVGDGRRVTSTICATPPATTGRRWHAWGSSWPSRWRTTRRLHGFSTFTRRPRIHRRVRGGIRTTITSSGAKSGFGSYTPPLPSTSTGPVINTAPKARRPAAVRIRPARRRDR